MAILEFDKVLVDKMHIEGAIFHAVNSAEGIDSFECKGGGVFINGNTVTIKETCCEYIVDLSQLQDSDLVADKLETITNGGRMFPDSYSGDIPLDNINPINGGREVPVDVNSFYNKYGGWVDKSVSESFDNRVETAFLQDSLDNILGVELGDIDRITWPKSIVERHGIRFHTHPEIAFPADPSVADLKIIAKTDGNISADAIASTFGVERPFSLMYMTKQKEDGVVPREEVEYYVSSMRKMIEEELLVAFDLIEDGIIDINENNLGVGTIEQISSRRVDNDDKKDIVREMAEDGYTFEISWEVIE